jgi:hypothetical protein
MPGQRDMSDPEALKEYRAFAVTFARTVIHCYEFSCAYEEDAKRTAEELAKVAPIELWQGQHWIAHFKPVR